MVDGELPQAGMRPGGKGSSELWLLGTPGVTLCFALSEMSGSAAQQNKSGRVVGIMHTGVIGMKSCPHPTSQ